MILAGFTVGLINWPIANLLIIAGVTLRVVGR